LIRTFLEMLRLRSGPQDLPAANGLAVVLAVAWALQGQAADQILDTSDSSPRSLLTIAVQFAAVIMLLRLRGHSERIAQTISALAGTGLIFGVMALLLLSRFDVAEPQPELAVAYFGLFAWSLLVDGNIYRHALSIKMGPGVLVAVLIFAVNFILISAVFG